MPTFLVHTILLIASVTGVYVWLTLPGLSAYTLQLVAILILIFAATHWTRGRFNARPRRRTTVPLDLSLLTAALLLLVSETGALTSPFFFFLYFLLFAVSLLYEIEATLVLTGTLILYFLLLPSTNFADVTHLSQIAALLTITPLAIFTGHQYERMLESQRTTARLSQYLADEEADTLIFLSLNLKRTLLSSIDSLSQILPQARVKELRSDLSVLYQDLKNLYRSADELQQLIDRSDKS